MDRGPSVDVLRACDGGDGGGDDQKDQRTMKTLGRDIVGSLSLSLSLSLYLGRRCRFTDSFHTLPPPSALRTWLPKLTRISCSHT